jgi:membrane protein implicated in regulation of membrane protease activity
MNLIYFWLGLALLLIAAETFVPGAFLLWFGIAAGVMGLIVWLVPGLPVLGQIIVFAVLSALAVAAYRRWFRGAGPRSEQPLLNQRAAQLVGRTVELSEPIRNGRGKARIGDSVWVVEGPELPAGAIVSVTGTDGTALRVEAAPPRA